MRLGYFTMPVHPLNRPWHQTLKEDREAIILADRIGVMHAGPASKLKGIVEVTLSEAERERTHDRFLAVYRQVHEMIRDEVAISLQRAQ
mgnify:CR=1 FL=1